MTGPEHYHEAERLLAEAVSWDDNPTQVAADAVVVAAAQAHATLALAAATAQESAALPADGNTAGAWRRAIAAPRKPVGPAA